MLPERRSFDRGLPDISSCSEASELFEALNQARWGSSRTRRPRIAHLTQVMYVSSVCKFQGRQETTHSYPHEVSGSGWWGSLLSLSQWFLSLVLEESLIVKKDENC